MTRWDPSISEPRPIDVPDDDFGDDGRDGDGVYRIVTIAVLIVLAIALIKFTVFK